MLTDVYLTSTKNLSAILAKIREGTAPNKFSVAHLKSLGFTSSNDQGVPKLLKAIGFLTPDGSPTARYHEYRDHSKSKAVMAEALREAYKDIFHVSEHPTKADRKAIEGKFKSTHNATERVATELTRTFFALLDEADLEASAPPTSALPDVEVEATPEDKDQSPPPRFPPKIVSPTLHYNIQVHLPATKDIEVYNAIFKALRVHLFDV